MNTDWWHLVQDEVVLRVLGPRPMLTCVCCRTRYERGKFRCCAPPNGMAGHDWLKLSCPMPDQGGCGKCMRHCQCPNRVDRLPGKGPLADLCKQFVADPPGFIDRAGL